MNRPLISICIPTRNVAEYLAECLKSCLIQTYKNIEVIVVDDGSTDSTPVILKYFQEKDERVKVIRIEHSGIAQARNTAIAASQGEYIAVMDSDDVCYAGRLKIALRELQKTGADVFYSAYLRGNQEMEIQDGITPVKHFSFQRTKIEDILKTQLIPHVTIVAKRQCFIDHPYRESLKVNDDMGLILDWWEANYQFCMSKHPLVLVRFHNQSTSITKDKYIRDITSKLRKEFKGKGYL